jgi:hypothetical protein
MKRTVRLAILGAMLHGGAQAAAQDVTTQPSLNTVGHTQAVLPVAKKHKAVRSKKNKAARTVKVKSKSRVGMEAPDPKPADKPDAVTQTPPEIIEQSIQVKGVRG